MNLCRRLAVAVRGATQFEASLSKPPATRRLEAAGTSLWSQCAGFGLMNLVAADVRRLILKPEKSEPRHVGCYDSESRIANLVSLPENLAGNFHAAIVVACAAVSHQIRNPREHAPLAIRRAGGRAGRFWCHDFAAYRGPCAWPKFRSNPGFKNGVQWRFCGEGLRLFSVILSRLGP